MRTLIYALAIASGLAFYSCDEQSRLAKNVEGTWSGTTQTIINEPTVQASGIEYYTFDISQGETHGGTVDLSSLVSITTGIGSDSSQTVPVTATIRGSWSVVDDDEISIIFDASSLNVFVDPNAANADIILGMLTHTLQMRYLGVNHLDDIKVKGDRLKFEIGKTDFTFTRVKAL